MTADLPSYRVRFVQLTALWAYGVSQPLFVVIDGNPDLVLSRDLNRVQVALFALAVALVPPALAVGYVRLAGAFSAWIADVLFLLTVGAFLAPVAIRMLKPVDTGMAVTVALVAAISVAGVVLYARFRAARMFLAYSIVLPLAGLVWFVHGAPTLTDEAAAANAHVGSPVPVVMLVLDELPASSLMTRQGAIDSVRYPAFGRLGRDATWYPNATTVHEWTSDAVPSILTGRIGGASALPTLDNHPENLFTLVEGSYPVHAHETVTHLCPKELCPAPQKSVVGRGYGLFVAGLRTLLKRALPRSLSSEVVHVNGDIAMEADADASITRFDTLLSEIGASGAHDGLYYDHLLLPHAPWQFLPSGERYDFRDIDGWSPTELWGDDSWAVLQGYQRHLLQVGYTDRLVGKLLRELVVSGVYDRALVVVVADHGASFRAGQGRRPLTQDNLADITNVPLFVKYPGQRRGLVDPRPARTVDVLPTIADVLGIHLPWRLDGTSLRGPLPARRDVTVKVRGDTVVHAPLQRMIRDRAITLARKYAAFGQGRDSLYRIGDNRTLLGKDTRGAVNRSSSIEVRIDTAAALARTNRASGFLPVRLTGHVTSGEIQPGTELAVAVNGRVEALTRPLEDTAPQLFRAIVPPSTIHGGFNRVDVFIVDRTGKGARLILVGSSATTRA